jgi:hypothetical protein
VSEPEVLRIVLSIGRDEIAHFLEWVDFAGNGVQTPIAPLTDPITGLVVLDFNATADPLLETHLIFPLAGNVVLPEGSSNYGRRRWNRDIPLVSRLAECLKNPSM